MQKYSVMILDDEEWIVRGLKSIINWENEGFTIIGEYTDSSVALDKIREFEPDLLVLDIHMLKISGDMMMEIIREEGIPCEFIIVSGYSDFSIAKKAIQHGAIDYILKPIEKGELLKAVQKVKGSLSQRKAEQGNLPIDPMNMDAFLSQISQGDLKNWEQYMYYQIMLVNTSQEIKMPSVKGSIFSCSVSVYRNRRMVLVASNENELPCKKEDLSGFAFENDSAVGLSCAGRSIQELHNMFRQADCALCSSYLQGKNDCYLYLPPDMKIVYEWLERLTVAYKSHDKHKIHCEISNLIDFCKMQGNPATIALLISQLTYNIVLDDEFKQNENPYVEKFLYDDISSQFSNVEEIFDYLLHLLSLEVISTDNNLILAPQIIRDMKLFIQENYAEDLSLNKLSMKFFLTPTYLCELFKKFTGYTITSYLLKIRMEHAALLLTTTTCSLVEISELIGYNDYNYFCRLFKRHFHVSPNFYRRQHNSVQ